MAWHDGQVYNTPISPVPASSLILWFRLSKIRAHAYSLWASRDCHRALPPPHPFIFYFRCYDVKPGLHVNHHWYTSACACGAYVYSTYRYCKTPGTPCTTVVCITLYVLCIYIYIFIYILYTVYSREYYRYTIMYTYNIIYLYL